MTGCSNVAIHIFEAKQAGGFDVLGAALVGVFDDAAPRGIKARERFVARLLSCGVQVGQKLGYPRHHGWQFARREGQKNVVELLMEGGEGRHAAPAGWGAGGTSSGLRHRSGRISDAGTTPFVK